MMTDTIQTAIQPRSRAHRPLGTRHLLYLAGIAAATLVPMVFMSGLVDDRQDRQAGVEQEIAKSWGPAQTIWGPTLVLSTSPSGYVRIAPKTLDIAVRIVPEQRRRGLFAATVYGVTAELSGTFVIPESARSTASSAVLAVSVSSLDGIDAQDAAGIGGDKAPWQLCQDVFGEDACQGGRTIIANIDPSKTKAGTLPFTATLHLHGTQALKFAVTANQMVASIQGAWPSPSYGGDTLPIKTALDTKGFDAQWRHDEIGKPRVSTGPAVFDFAAPDTTIGVDLLEATPVYRMIDRAAKYSPLIVVLSFATYLLFEILSGLRITPLQYALLGASISLFTLLLLSLSEIVGYPTGYTLSACLVLAQASIYTASVGRRVRPTIVFATMLAGLFGFLYMLLGLESYALLVGTVALFIVLSIIMAVSQQVTQADPVPLDRETVSAPADALPSAFTI